ncbi:MAG: 3-isopropylmalate dehydratase small subunit [Pseudomonadota bacterium]|jgi:3-isopropylmalate/(R)-2-methylmalate dehydratase small subunit
MQPFTGVTSIAAPVAIKDVDTDMIIPAQYLTSISRDGFGPHLFVRLRTSRPDFYQNQPRFSTAEILISDTNFGCGSSREHAVWALLGAGVRVVIAPSFADIFAGNSAKNGLLLITLPEAQVHDMLAEAAEKDLILSVDLAQQKVSAVDGRTWSFAYDPFRKHCLLNGLDDLDFLRSHLDVISSKKNELKENWFYSTLTPNR